MKIGLSGGYFNHPLEEQIRKFQSMPEFLLYDGLRERRHEVIPFSTESFPLQKLDILHCHHYSRILHYLSVMKRFPLIFTPHNPFVFSPDYQLSWLDRIALKRIDALVVLSNAEKQVYMNRFGLSDKIHIIPNGLKVSLYDKPDELHFRHTWGIPEDKVVVLFVGQLLPYKGLEYLFKAVEGLDVVLVVKSHYNPNLDSHKAIAPKNTIFITDVLSQKELTDLYYSCDIYCQPSLAEALPTVITEAMICGKPIVATKVGGISEQVPENCGFLVQPKNALQLREYLELLSENATLREGFGENAKSHALEVYTQQQMVKKHIKLYTKLRKTKLGYMNPQPHIIGESPDSQLPRARVKKGLG